MVKEPADDTEVCLGSSCGRGAKAERENVNHPSRLASELH